MYRTITIEVALPLDNGGELADAQQIIDDLADMLMDYEPEIIIVSDKKDQ